MTSSASRGKGGSTSPTRTSTAATVYHVIGLQAGIGNIATPTAVTEINDGDEIGGQAHGAGVESVFVTAKAMTNPGTFEGGTITFPLSGDTSYPFKCYTGVLIRHVVGSRVPDNDYAVTVTSLGSENCTANIDRNAAGGSRTAAANGTFTFTTTDTTVGN